MKQAVVFLIFVGAVFALMLTYTARMEKGSADILTGILKADKVVMLNVGAEFCPRCSAMQPILEELRREYENQVYFPYIDIREHNDKARQLGVRTTPTQIFYDHTGSERYRHEGFMEKEEVKDILQELLARY